MAKFTPGDLDELYALVVAECKKRTATGQNLSKACPTLTFNDDAKKLIKAEDINEILKILQIIEQGKNIPVMDGKNILRGDKASQITITNAKEYITTLASYSNNIHNTNTGCAGDSCQGLCRNLCLGGCSGGCSSGCDGGCGGCKQTCASACSQDCRTYCGGFCQSSGGSTTDSLYPGTCVGSCTGGCDSGCGGSGSCKGGCAGTCSGQCKGCSGCAAACQSNCSGGCSGNCKNVAGF